MKKLENYTKMIEILANADRARAHEDDVYRMGVIGLFNLTFELAWKSLKEVMSIHGVDVSKTGSPREILKEGYSIGFVSDADIWLDMMLKRNLSIHVYDSELATKLVNDIFDSYIPAFVKLRDTLESKMTIS